MEKLVTIFTPTYNRAYILGKLYESLKSQTVQNFEWIIVDDGSTDETSLLVESFIEEKQIPITYIKQTNQGKHIAINTGIAHAKGDFFLIVDSDDYLLAHCMERCEEIMSHVAAENIAGFTFIHFSEKIKYDPLEYNNKMWFYDEEGEYEWGENKGEMSFCYKTKILKKFSFPKFEGEKFCSESLIHHRIGNEYRVFYTNYVMMRGEYLEDGLTTKYSLLMEKNPRGAMLVLSEKIQDSKDFSQREAWARQYWNIALKAKHISWIEKFKGISLFLSIKFWVKRLLRIK